MLRATIHTIIITVSLFFATQAFATSVGPQDMNDIGKVEKTYFITKSIKNSNVIRISEILGALHHIEALCTKSTGMVWRVQMFAMLSAYSDNEDMHENMIQKFNESYYNFSSDHVYCSPLTKRIMTHMIEEGKTVSSHLSQSNQVNLASHIDLSK